jgi:hypothetical protein
MAAFASIDRTLEAFSGSSFVPYAFAGRTHERALLPDEAAPRSTSSAGLARTLRLDERGARTLVHVRGGQVVFRRTAGIELVRAGYTLETKCERESVYRRWLAPDEVGAEVSLLDSLDRACLTGLPTRGPSPHRDRLDDDLVARALFSVRSTSTTWDECSLGLEHKLDLVGACGAYHVVVAALTLEGTTERTFESYVGIASRDPSKRVSSCLASVLDRAGYSRVGVSENTSFLCANRRFSSAEPLAEGSLEIVAAIREGARFQAARSRA